MSDFNGIPSFGGNSPVVRPAPAAPPPEVPAIEPGQGGRGLTGEMTYDRQRMASGATPKRAALTEQQPEQRPRARDPSQLAGPSPAFQASVLELELDLQNTIARVEAARGKRESDKASGMEASELPKKQARGSETHQAASHRAAEDTRNAEIATRSAGETENHDQLLGAPPDTEFPGKTA